MIEGPRLTVGVQALLTSVGGTAGRLIPDEGEVGYARVVNTPDEMVTWTRRHIKAGADWIKIHATGRIPGHAGELPGVDRGRAAGRVRHRPRPRHPGVGPLPRRRLDRCGPPGPGST